MSKPLIEMPKLPDNSGLSETVFASIHGAPYLVVMDGLDTYIYQHATNNGKTLNELCRFAGAEITERMGVALLRAATLQREAEAGRKARHPG